MQEGPARVEEVGCKYSKVKDRIMISVQIRGLTIILKHVPLSGGWLVSVTRRRVEAWGSPSAFSPWTNYDDDVMLLSS